MAWKPLNETYFVRPEELKGISDLVPEAFRKNLVELRTGIVTHTGTGTLMDSGVRIPLQANVGDRVLFGAKVGHEIEVDGEKLLLIAEANVLAVETK